MPPKAQKDSWSSRSLLSTYYADPLSDPTVHEQNGTLIHCNFSGMSDATRDLDLSQAVHEAYIGKTVDREWHVRESAAILEDWIDAKAVFEDTAVFTVTFVPVGSPKSFEEVKECVKPRLPLQFRNNRVIQDYMDRVVEDIAALIYDQAMITWKRVGFSPAIRKNMKVDLTCAVPSHKKSPLPTIRPLRPPPGNRTPKSPPPPVSSRAQSEPLFPRLPPPPDVSFSRIDHPTPSHAPPTSPTRVTKHENDHFGFAGLSINEEAANISLEEMKFAPGPSPLPHRQQALPSRSQVDRSRPPAVPLSPERAPARSIFQSRNAPSSNRSSQPPLPPPSLPPPFAPRPSRQRVAAQAHHQDGDDDEPYTVTQVQTVWHGVRRGEPSDVSTLTSSTSSSNPYVLDDEDEDDLYVAPGGFQNTSQVSQHQRYF
ncbi:hypothetical protein SISNIDRAFT_484246 [Sistotremastrum niveocremeum HHB9708]|uniref:Uncharacterized protein n=1 Tax=Sistotremastrum niveocremeum HHB9708 TaxID=1314777 RepID=A0A164W3J8_9AGAM|nr:hypothetical protein SISNIDRAFT_484246 [Sistotremastrum niveocremeum HHB9708]